MPSYSKALFALTFLSAAIALPTPQLAGEGQAADAIFTDTDNAVGFGIKNAENNLAGNVATLKASLPATRRQLAGEGQAADAIFTDTDNAVGFGIKNAEENLAGNVATLKGSTRRQLAGEGQAADAIFTDTDNAVGYGIKNAENNLAGNVATLKASVPAVPAARRQLDKISDGFQAVSNAAGTGSLTSSTTGTLDSVDGALTSGAANAGQQIGTTEESVLEGAGSAVPKSRRQLDKVSDGFQAISNAAGTGASTSGATGTLDSVDGSLTGGAAQAGQQIGTTEESVLEGAGSAVPKSRRQLDKVSDGFQAISNAAGTGASTSGVTGTLDSVDGSLTGGAAQAGQQIGTTEESVLEGAGSAVPKL